MFVIDGPCLATRVLTAGLMLASSSAASAADRSAADADLVLSGTAAGAQFGRSVVILSDLDGLGARDLAVAQGGAAGGEVYVISVETGALIRPVIDGAASGSSFGEALAVGDVNGDGHADIIIGAWGDSVAGTGAGRVIVVSGADSTILHAWTGDEPGDNFGDSVACAGDLDGDGGDDVIVGVPTNDFAGTNAGRIYAFSGCDGNELWTCEGESELDRLGVEVAAANDVGPKGTRRVIAGAHLFGSSPASSENAGRAYLIDAADGSVITHFTGEEAGDNFGWSVDAAGDVNGDGVGDVIVGAPLNDALGSNTGRTYVYSGDDGTLIHRLTGEAAVDKLGLSVSRLGDLDGDGKAELLAGAWWNDGETGDPGDDRGRAYIFSGATGDIIDTVTGEGSNDHLARPVTSGDLNGDGLVDLVLAARDHDGVGEDSGRVYVFISITIDLNGDGAVGFADLLMLLSAWGPCPTPGICPADLDRSGDVGFSDLLQIISAWD